MQKKAILFNIIKCLGAVSLLGLSVFALNHSFKGLAPIGRLISPATGLWRHQPTDIHDVSKRLEKALKEAGLQPVELEFDDNEVPHLKSDSETALYFAQGFVTSYFRLWQMDFLSRITAGRVSEIVGKSALPVDRFFRRFLIPAAARESANLMMADPVTKGPLAAYTQGVNARMAQIDISSLPIEYRLFGVLPEPWSDERAAHLLKFMTWELTGYLYDVRMTASKTRLSEEIFQLLFPTDLKLQGTIMGERKASLGSASQSGESTSARLQAFADVSKMSQPPAEVLPDSSNGSNSWALPGNRVTTGRPLLANDLHLGYTLPALWFSIQLTSPKMNVYGASLPGAPGVIVGFTETMGWAVTNGTNDVLDWYSLRFRDEKRQEYMFEDSWRPVVTRDEVIEVAGSESEVVQTRETHVGPIVFEEGDTENIISIPAGLAAQWTGHQPSNEIKTFLLLNRAERARDCMAALQSYEAPAQNFLCADRFGKLVFKHAGLFPDRRGRDGRFVFEAMRDTDLWQGRLPHDSNPTMETDSQPIVTANQAPFSGPDLDKFGWFFRPPYRALQIRKKIDLKNRWKPEEMVEVQADTESLSALSFKKLVTAESKNSVKLKEAFSKPFCGMSGPTVSDMLSKWKSEHTAKSQIASLMNQWFKSFESQTWKRLIGDASETYWPSAWRLFELSETHSELSSKLWDDASTPSVETLDDRLNDALIEACAVITSQFGNTEGGPEWSSFQKTSVRHTGRLPGLGKVVKAGGVAEAIFANKGEHGPTWKMIVSFENTPRAWTMIPGGQSGDPSSKSYDRWLEAWSKGEMLPATFKMRNLEKKR